MGKAIKAKLAKRKLPSRKERTLQRNNFRLTYELRVANEKIEGLSHTINNIVEQNAAFRNLGFCMRGRDWPFLDFERMVKAFTQEELDVLLATIKKRTDPPTAEYAIPVSLNAGPDQPHPAQAVQ